MANETPFTIEELAPSQPDANASCGASSCSGTCKSMKGSCCMALGGPTSEQAVVDDLEALAATETAG